MEGLEGLFWGTFGLCKDLKSSSGDIFGTWWGAPEISEASLAFLAFGFESPGWVRGSLSVRTARSLLVFVTRNLEDLSTQVSKKDS